MDLYSLEFFIEHLDIGPNNKVKRNDVQVKVKCSDFLEIQIKYFIKLSAYNLKKSGVGKAVVFSCIRSKLVSGFNSDFRVIINDTDEFETLLGTADIKWTDNFENQLRALHNKSASHIQHSGKYDIKNEEGKVTGLIQAEMCLVSYGNTIEVPITYLGSQIAIPLSFRQSPKFHQSAEEWSPLFLAPKKPVKSVMDPGMRFYAEMAGIQPQPDKSTLLTPDYINSHLCNNKACPGAQRFKEFGLGPLATEGSGLGTVVSIKDSKPCGLYGMSQAYGTMDNYGAYGLFVQKPKRPKSCCDSPDCPYTIYFGKPDEIPPELLNDRPKQCHCRNCRKNNSKNKSPPRRSTSSTPKRDNSISKAAPNVSNTCGGPGCPYGALKVDSNCGSINCQYGAAKVDKIPKQTGCGNPTCEAAKVDTTCEGPKCPYGVPKVDSTCGSVNCQYGGSKVKQTGCGNPNCGAPKVESTCHAPNCPKVSRKSGVTCPFLNKPPRQSAGADKYAEVCQKDCPYSTQKQNKRQSINGRGTCGGVVCPLLDSLTAMDTTQQQNKRQSINKYGEVCQKDCPYSTQHQNKRQSINSRGTCGGAVCPLQESLTEMDTTQQQNKRQSINSRGTCGGVVCPLQDSVTAMDTTQQQNNRQSINGRGTCGGVVCPLQDPLTAMDSFLTSVASKSTGRKRNCSDKTCLYYEESEEYRVTEEEEIGPCGGRICPLDKREKSFSPEEIFGEYSGNNLVDSSKRASTDHPEGESKQKRLSVLINEDGNKILLNANGDSVSFDPNNLTHRSIELLSTLSLADHSDIFFLISRLVAERKRSYSLNNYFSMDESKSFSDDKPAAFKNFDLKSIDIEKKKKKPRGPCDKHSCKFQKYKTCSECGGVSRSGATCDNTNVSFSTISYDSIVTTPETITQNIEPEDKPKTLTDKKKQTTPDGKSQSQHDKMTVKIAKSRRKKSRFAYGAGEVYPGIRVGHKTCIIGYKNVPANMGWLWNTRSPGDPKRKKGWRPGVMYKIIEQRIIDNRRRKGIPDPPELKMLAKKVKLGYQDESESDEEEILPKPTLTIEKKEGNYLITMNPLKDPNTLAPYENPYIRCKPMQFLIVKPKKESPAGPLFTGSETCEDEDFYGNCGCDIDSKMSMSSSSSDSELNIEFTTPAGLINPEDMKRPPNVINTCTQFQVTDFECDDCTIIIPKKFKKEKKKRRI